MPVKKSKPSKKVTLDVALKETSLQNLKALQEQTEKLAQAYYPKSEYIDKYVTWPLENKFHISAKVSETPYAIDENAKASEWISNTKMEAKTADDARHNSQFAAGGSPVEDIGKLAPTFFAWSLRKQQSDEPLSLDAPFSSMAMTETTTEHTENFKWWPLEEVQKSKENGMKNKVKHTTNMAPMGVSHKFMENLWRSESKEKYVPIDFTANPELWVNSGPLIPDESNPQTAAGIKTSSLENNPTHFAWASQPRECASEYRAKYTQPESVERIKAVSISGEHDLMIADIEYMNTGNWVSEYKDNYKIANRRRDPGSLGARVKPLVPRPGAKLLGKEIDAVRYKCESLLEDENKPNEISESITGIDLDEKSKSDTVSVPAHIEQKTMSFLDDAINSADGERYVTEYEGEFEWPQPSPQDLTFIVANRDSAGGPAPYARDSDVVSDAAVLQVPPKAAREATGLMFVPSTPRELPPPAPIMYPYAIDESHANFDAFAPPPPPPGTVGFTQEMLESKTGKELFKNGDTGALTTEYKDSTRWADGGKKMRVHPSKCVHANRKVLEEKGLIVQELLEDNSNTAIPTTTCPAVSTPPTLSSDVPANAQTSAAQPTAQEGMIWATGVESSQLGIGTLFRVPPLAVPSPKPITSRPFLSSRKISSASISPKAAGFVDSPRRSLNSERSLWVNGTTGPVSAFVGTMETGKRSSPRPTSTQSCRPMPDSSSAPASNLAISLDLATTVRESHSGTESGTSDAKAAESVAGKSSFAMGGAVASSSYRGGSSDISALLSGGCTISRPSTAPAPDPDQFTNKSLTRTDSSQSNIGRKYNSREFTNTYKTSCYNTLSIPQKMAGMGYPTRSTGNGFNPNKHTNIPSGACGYSFGVQKENRSFRGNESFAVSSPALRGPSKNIPVHDKSSSPAKMLPYNPILTNQRIPTYSDKQLGRWTTETARAMAAPYKIMTSNSL